jgi:hypothetical protein
MRYTIETLIKRGEEFVPLGEVRESPPDPDYIEGAIVWEIDHQSLLTSRHWDLVDQLWAYIADGVDKLRHGLEFETYFPDQPLLLRFKRLNPHSVEVTIGEDRFVVHEEPFFASLMDGGNQFFSRMLELLPQFESTWNRYRQLLKSNSSAPRGPLNL